MWLDEMVKIILKVPVGKVVSYGQVASFLGSPRSARMIGWGLSRLPYNTDVPWHRVVNRNGEITISHPYITPSVQAQLLKNEGVEVIFVNNLYKIDIKKYGYSFLNEKQKLD